MPIGQQFYEYINKWKHYNILVKDLRGFIKDSEKNLTLLIKRINKEEKKLFTLISKLPEEINFQPKVTPSNATLKKAFTVLEGVKFPTMPDIALQLEKETNKKSPDLSKIAKMVNKDPVIAGIILKTINSPCFATKKKIESIAHATMMMGLNNFKNIVLTTVIKNALAEIDDTANDIWCECNEAAACSVEISKFTHAVSTDEAYMVGLFHDVGALLLARKDIGYHKIYQQSTHKPLSILSREKKEYQVNHAEAGFIMAVKWKLPDAICKAIYLHHTPVVKEISDSKVRQLISIIKLSNAFVINSKNEISLEEAEYQQDAINELGLSHSDMASLTSKLSK